MKKPVIILKSGKDQSLMRFHPWVFSGAIKKIKGEVREGVLVDVFNSKDEYLATGHFQNSSIAVRILSFENEEIDVAFWEKKIQKAYSLRVEAGLVNHPDTNVFRLVNAEGDGLPGLIIDYYNGNIVMQMHSAGMFLAREQIMESLRKIPDLKIVSVYDKSAGSLPFKAGIETQDSYLFGNGDDRIVIENKNKFVIDREEGQKTGFFIDQRESRALVHRFSSGKKVLNMFGYTGGFSVYALSGGAELVHSVDASKKAIELTNENVLLNFPNDPRHQSYAMDAFKFFEETKQKYDLLILDPPAFAKHNNVLHNALQGYKKLNRKAIELISPGGILFTFSCSQVVSRENFRKSVFTAAANTGRKLQLLYQLSQPPDHPVSIYHPEGEYLKGLVLKVD